MAKPMNGGWGGTHLFTFKDLLTFFPLNFTKLTIGVIYCKSLLIFLVLLFFVFCVFVSFLRFIFKEGTDGREGEKPMCKSNRLVAFRMPPTGYLTHNPGMCWELKEQPFGLQISVQFTEPHQAGCFLFF